MTPYQVRNIAKQYRKMFDENGIVPRKHPDDKLASQPANFEHCYWMCIEIDKLLNQNNQSGFETAMGSLCFVQGCLWSYQQHTISDLKDHNR